MSMNLHAKVNGSPIGLWQTPSRISYTIMGDDRGEEIRGAEAKKALKRYYQWVKYSVNGSWSSSEDLEAHREGVKEHLAYIEQFINRKGLVVYVM